MDIVRFSITECQCASVAWNCACLLETRDVKLFDGFGKSSKVAAALLYKVFQDDLILFLDFLVGKTLEVECTTLWVSLSSSL
jgi:hypothetical protein